MSKVNINILDTDSIDQAISEIEAYAKAYEENVSAYKQKLAEECAAFASANFSDSWYDDYVDVGENTYAFSARTPRVACYVDNEQNDPVVKAEGEDAVWVEFGAGIHYNLSLGSSPHPWGVENNFLIGEYGFKHGSQHAWLAPNGLTRGTKAQMPLFNACMQTQQIAEEIAKEIFKDDRLR